MSARSAGSVRQVSKMASFAFPLAQAPPSLSQHAGRTDLPAA